MRTQISRASTGLSNTNEAPVPGAVKEGREWYVEINNLADLQALIDAEGKIVIEPDGGDYAIIVYDDYLE